MKQRKQTSKIGGKRVVMPVPFYENINHNHDYQAVIQMLVEYLFGEKYSQQELEPISHKLPDKWTWPTATLLWLQENGTKIDIVDMFDYARFATEGLPYLEEFMGKEAAAKQNEFSDLAAEQALITKSFVPGGLHAQRRLPTIEDIISYIDSGSLVYCAIDAGVLAKLEEYAPRSVLVVGYDTTKRTIIFHDPGARYPEELVLECGWRGQLLPPAAYREIPIDDFIAAWHSPNESAANLTAFRRKASKEGGRRVVIPVPFYENINHNHCHQAVMQMLVEYLFGEKYSQQELAFITHKLPNKWTWPTASFLWLQKKGVEVTIVERFDYARFAAEGLSYLEEFMGKEAATKQNEHSVLSAEQAMAAEALKQGGLHVLYRIPTVKDIISYIDNGFLLQCAVNSRKLAGVSGYASHSVLIVGYDTTKRTIIFHDPGTKYSEALILEDKWRGLLLPPTAYREIPIDDFLAAWHYPDDSVANLAAFRRKAPEKT